MPPQTATLHDTLARALHEAAAHLSGHSDSPRLDAELLLGKVTGLSRAALIVRGERTLDSEQVLAYDELLQRRIRGIPVAYLTGTREFWSLSLTVTPDVLIPRPETELLVELALQLLPEHKLAAPGPAPTVLDLGTGSGALALAIAAERPHARVTAVDVSEQALAVAIHNARVIAATLPAVPLRAAPAPIEWRLGSWFDAVPGERFDVIVANPPYVPAGDPALELLAAEPLLALVPGPSGLEALAAIIGRASGHLKAQGWLLLEHGSTQADTVAALLEQHGFRDIRSQVDYSGKPRVTLGSHHSQHQEIT